MTTTANRALDAYASRFPQHVRNLAEIVCIATSGPHDDFLTTDHTGAAWSEMLAMYRDRYGIGAVELEAAVRAFAAIG